MKSGQTQIVSAVLIIALAVGAVATVLPWSSNLIDKKKDMKNLEEVYTFFKELDSEKTGIRYIANTGGELSLTIDTPGKLTVYPEAYGTSINNSIIFEFQSKVSNIAECDETSVPDINFCWIPLNTPNANESATLGLDTPSVIFGMANSTGDRLTIYYRLWYRELIDEITGKGYKIIINTTDNDLQTSTTGFMRIQRIGSRDINVDGKTLTITEVNIFL